MDFRRAGVTQLVECDLAKVDVAGSNPVSRSKSFPPAAMIRRILSLSGCFLVALAGALAQAQPALPAEGPHFLSGDRLERPANYREWIWLSSGVGMSYLPAAQASADPAFDNVFVTPAAYRAFLQTGKWPDQTMFVLEVRASQSKGSINQSGHFQGALMGIEAEVKDERRFPGKWAFFGFQGGADSAAAFPKSERCYSCHAQNGAVDNTFVQFYPTLLEIAKQ
jgi:hypothetical protein